MHNCKILVFVIVISLFQACYCDADCDQTDYSAYLRILSKSDSTDLVFGDHRKYQADKMKFFSLDNGDTTYLFYQISTLFPDSALNVSFDPPVSTAYIAYDEGDIDTLQVFTRTTDSKCCGTIVKVEEFTFNHLETIGNAFPATILYK